MNYIKQLQEKIKKLEGEVLEKVGLYDPAYNDKVIVLLQEEDGNWRGKTQKNGKLIEARTNDPQTVLLALITHE